MRTSTAPLSRASPSWGEGRGEGFQAGPGTLLALAALTLFAGCSESRAVEAEKKAAAAKAAADLYNEREIQPIEQAMHALRAEVAEHARAASSATRELHELQQALTRSWGGDANTMRARISGASMSAELVPWLEKAQQAAGATTVERRFADAVTRDAPDELALALTGWESSGFSPQSGEGPVADAQQCERVAVELECAALPSDEASPPPRSLCKGTTNPTTFILSADEDQVFARRLEPEARGTVKVVRTLAPEWWMIRRDHKEKVDARSADRDATVSSRGWIGLVRLGPDSATERLAFATEDGDKTVAVAPADLDADGIDEVVVIGPVVRAAHYSPLTHDMGLWTEEETCARLAPRAEPALSAAKQRCAEVQAAARKKEEPAK